MGKPLLSRGRVLNHAWTASSAAFTRQISFRGSATAYMPDAEGMKEKMRQQICKPKYNVSMYYHETGFTQWIARHPKFEQVTLILVGLNALWIWIDTDYNPASMLLSSHPVFQIVENSFCIYFTLEWSMRFGAFKNKRDGLQDAWFVFDSLLAVAMIFETWLMTAIIVFVTNGESARIGTGNTGLLRIARLLRLTRMARMARLSRAAPELIILMKGMVAAMRSVWLTLGLLFIMLYIFGIAFVQLCHDSPCETFFPDVLGAMHELLLNCALMDNLSKLAVPLKEQSLILLFLLYAFIFLSASLLMNTLLGIICQVVSSVAATERESLSLSFVHEKIQKLVQDTGVDKDHDQRISKNEFMQLLVNPKAIAILQDVGVDVVGLVDFQDTLFENEECHAKMEGDDDEDDVAVVQAEETKLTISDLMGLVLDLRGGNAATVRDIVNLRKYINGRFSAIEKQLARSSRWKSVGGSSQTVAALSNPTTLPLPEEPAEELASDSINPCSSARLRSSRRFQDMFHSLQGMMLAHEAQVAALESANCQLKEQVAQMAQDASTSSPRKACTFCKEFEVTPNAASVNPPNSIQAPNEPMPMLEIRTEPSLPCSALRTAAKGSAAGSCWQEVDVGAAKDTAAGNS